MAMGGGSYGKGNGGGNRVRVMLLVAFGAALMGVMLVHKLRERRIFTLLVKEKDRELVSLHFLLQKERDLVKEMKRKNEETIVALKTQDDELENRLSEMQSTIASLKDEQRSVALALEEKQNEIKLLRDKEGDSGSEMAALSERLKQKDAEVEDLRHKLEVPVKVQIVSTDEPSNQTVNMTVPQTVTETEQDHETQQSSSITTSKSAEAGGASGANVTGAEVGDILQKTDESGNGSSSNRARGSRMKGKRWRRRRSEKNADRSEKNTDNENDGARTARRLRSRRLSREEPKSEMNKAQGEEQIVFKTRNESGVEEKKPENSEDFRLDKGEVREGVHSPEAENQNPDRVAKEGEATKTSSPVDGEAVEETNSAKNTEVKVVGEEHEGEYDPEIVDKKGERPHAANDDIFSEPSSNPDEETEEYKEETDVSEF